jgi:hypothetical protein
MKFSYIFLFTHLVILGLSSSIQAKIPLLIEKEMEIRVLRKNCQSEWVNQDHLYKKMDLNTKGHSLYAIACSNWGYNTNWSLFFTIENEEGELQFVKSLYFVRYLFYKGLYSDEVVSNISWDDTQKELTSFRSLNGTRFCGEIGGYRWDAIAQDFKVKGIIKKDNCNSTDAWEELKTTWEDL